MSQFLTQLRHILTQSKLLFWRSGSYAQTGEDAILEILAADKPIKTYLEIGGCHPVYLSNSYKFYRQGARGVIVEPNPVLGQLFKLWRGGDTWVGAAVSATQGKPLTFYRFLAATLNTTDAKEAKATEAMGYKPLPSLTVPRVTPAELLATYFPTQAPDFITLDIEGGEDAILEAWPWDKPNANPRFWVLETISFTQNTIYQARIKTMEERGYRVVAQTHINTIFARIEASAASKKSQKA